MPSSPRPSSVPKPGGEFPCAPNVALVAAAWVGTREQPSPCVKRTVPHSLEMKKRAHHLARPEDWFNCLPWSTLLYPSLMPNRGPGVYPWSFQGGYGSPEGRRGEIEIPPDPLALAERAENNTRHGSEANGMRRHASKPLAAACSVHPPQKEEPNPCFPSFTCLFSSQAA